MEPAPANRPPPLHDALARYNGERLRVWFELTDLMVVQLAHAPGNADQRTALIQQAIFTQLQMY